MCRWTVSRQGRTGLKTVRRNVFIYRALLFEGVKKGYRTATITIIKFVRAMQKIGALLRQRHDDSVGSAGFLHESFEHLEEHNKNRSAAQDKTLQPKLFTTRSKITGLYYWNMNMILHGFEAPYIIHTNTLNEILADTQDKNRYDIVLANPLFGGKERVAME